MSLLSDIEAAAIDSAVPLPDLLRRCKVLAARLKHQEFATWISRELNGYDSVERLPDYRRLARGPSFGNFAGPGRVIKNSPLSVSTLPEEFRTFVTEYNVLDSVSSLEVMASADGHELRWQWPADLVNYVARHHQMFEYMTLLDAWAAFPAGQLKGVLDTVRTRVLDFALAIEAEMPNAGEANTESAPPLSLKTVSHHFHTTIYGGQAIIGAGAQSSFVDESVTSTVNQGDQYIANNANSNVGSVAMGEGAVATGKVVVTDTFSQAHHIQSVVGAQCALVRDQTTLDGIDERLFEALSTFLRLARNIQVDGSTVTEVQGQLKKAVDDVWAEQVAKGMTSQLLPTTLEVMAALAASPVMVEVVKRLGG